MARVTDQAEAYSPGVWQAEKGVTRSFLSFASLLKLRVVGLLLFVSLATAYLAAHGAIEPESVVLLLLTGTMAAGGAGAVNQYLERDLDGLMERTRERPLVIGRIGRPREALWFGLSLIGLSLAIALLQNRWLALFLAAGVFVYVVLYTIWLKRRSTWNVIVGGAAGSCAVLSGWAAVDPHWTIQPLLLALLLFFWTPPHFWSLAIARLDDYRRAELPMLPVVAGEKAAAGWSLLHVLLVVGTAMILGVVGPLGTVYLGIALPAGLIFLAAAIRMALWPEVSRARLQFKVSNLYLAVILVAMTLDTYLRDI